MSLPSLQPLIEIYDHSSRESEANEVDLAALKRGGELALPLVFEHPGSESPVLPTLTEIEVSLLTDEAIAAVHGEFLDDPTPTDVITFHHGEILISLDTARRAAPEHGLSTAQETLLYLIHGLLHLNGHTDLSEPERSQMHERQDFILQTVLNH